MRISDWSSDVCSSDLRDANRGARVAARFAEQRFEQLRRAVGDLRLIGEAGGAVDEHAELDDALDARPVATQCLPDLRDEHQRDALRSVRSEEHTSELQSLMRISYAVFCLKKKKKKEHKTKTQRRISIHQSKEEK